MKKACAWLDAEGIGYAFHDKAAGVDEAQLRGWVKNAGWERLLNRSGTTFRKLPDADKADLDERRAIALMLARPSMIRRPVVEGGRKLLVGFDPEAWREALGGA